MSMADHRGEVPQSPTNGSAQVTLTVDDHVAQVTLNRPAKLNALTVEMFTELVSVGLALKQRKDIRAVVLCGAGRAFCAGLDLKAFSAMAENADILTVLGTPMEMEGPACALGQQAVQVWAQLPMPVIAAVHGVAFGGGLQLCLGADVRIVAPDAKLSVMEVKWGLVADMTGTQILPGLIGIDHAKELAFTGRVVDGRQATALGLTTRTEPDPLASARDLAAEIACRSPDAVRATKALLGSAGHVDLAEGFAAEQRAIRELIGSPNQLEAVRATQDGRPARYDD